MNPKTLSIILLVALLFFLLLTVKTLLPNRSASKPCLLGYKAGCSFSPISSLILFWISAVIFAYRALLMNGAGTKAIPVWLIVLSALFLIAIIFYSYRYVTHKKSGIAMRAENTQVTGALGGSTTNTGAGPASENGSRKV